VAATAELAEHGAGLLGISRLAEQASPKSNDGIRSEHARVAVVGSHIEGLRGSEPPRHRGGPSCEE
jgi:hypothetical protein